MSGTNISIKLTVIQGVGLVAKDRNVFGKKTSSDPYVEVWALGSQLIGKTQTQKKTLAPRYNESFSIQLQQVTNPFCILRIFDEDFMSAPDSMGTVTVPIATDASSDTTQWYDVPPDSAKNASGKLQIRLEITVQHARALVRGNAFSLPPKSPHQSTIIKVGLEWDVTNGKDVDLDVSCVAISQQGQVVMSDTVYYGNHSNSNESVVHSGDEQEGDEEGDDESIVMNLSQVPAHVLAMYIILTVATPGMSIPDVKSTVLRVYDVHQHDLTLCTFSPAQQAMHGNHNTNPTAMFMVRIARSSSGTWIVSPLEDTHATARDFGCLIPQLKSYTRDLLPSIHVNPAERVAIMRKGGNIRLADYYAATTAVATTTAQLPETVTFGLAWDVTNGVNIDLDASAVCLDANLNLVDQVWFRQLRSKDGAILHHGDEREGDEIGDDEKMDLHLRRVDPRIQFIGFVINSYSGQELDDVARAACHLFDPQTELDMARYAMTDSHALDGFTALVVACLYRSNVVAGEWNLCIIAEPAMGRTVKDNVDELQNYLRRHPPQAMPMEAPVPVEEERMVLDNFAMPAPVPLAAATAPVVDPNVKPKKFVKINGTMKINPEWKKWNETH